MTNIVIKAKKGDAIVIETHGSSTEIGTLKTTWYTYYKIAKCAKSTRQGVVTHIEFPNSPVYMLDNNQSVICIYDPNRQEAAKRLYDNVKDNYFGTLKDIRKAVIEA